MAEVPVDKAKTLHSILGLASEEDEIKRNNTQEPLSADLIIVDEFPWWTCAGK